MSPSVAGHIVGLFYTFPLGTCRINSTLLWGVLSSCRSHILLPETLFNEWTVSGIVVAYLCIMWWVMWSMLCWLCLFVQGCAQLLLSTFIFTYFFSLLIFYFLLFHISKTTLLYLDDGFEEVCCFNVIFSLCLGLDNGLKMICDLSLYYLSFCHIRDDIFLCLTYRHWEDCQFSKSLSHTLSSHFSLFMI